MSWDLDRAIVDNCKFKAKGESPTFALSLLTITCTCFSTVFTDVRLGDFTTWVAPALEV